MRITIRLFAVLRELAGTSTFEMAVPEHATVADVIRGTGERFSELAKYAEMTSAAVNGEYAQRDRQVKDGDEIALLPPISGGRR